MAGDEERKEMTATELLKVFKELSGHAEKEIARVSGIYKIAAYCISAIFVAGIYYTYENAADLRKESRDEIKEQRELIRGEIERQEKQMRERQEALFSQMQTQLSHQVAILRQTVEKRVDDEFKKENISKLVSDKAQERVDPIISKTIQPKIDYVDKSLEQFKGEIRAASDRLNKVQTNADFFDIGLKAQNDDRRAFDQLKRWADDPKFYRQKDAWKAYWQIVDGNESLAHVPYSYVPWPEGVDPAKLSLTDLFNIDFAPNARVKLLHYIWDRKDFTKKQKMSLMVEIMKNHESLQVVAEASRFFQEESKQEKKPLLVDFMLDWWEKNKGTITE